MELKSEMLPDDLVQIVEIKFTKSSKTYSYLIIDDVNIGDDVYIKGKDKPYKALDVKTVKVKELPVSFEDMKLASKEPYEDSDIERLLKNNQVLRRMNNHHVKIIGRDDEINELLIAINKKRMKNTVIIGDPGCGKTTLVEAFSQKVEKNYHVLMFSVGDIVAGTQFRGMLEERLTRICNDVLEYNRNHYKKIIIFIDEIHMIMGKPGMPDDVSMHDILKPFLTDPDAILIGATTLREYAAIKKDKAFMRRITPIYISSLGDDAILKILKQFSNDEIPLDLLELILDESKDIPNTTNPDISIEIVDRVLATKKVLGIPIDPDLVLKTISKLKNSYQMEDE